MIAIRVEIIDYDKASNTCTARLMNGDIVELDPFVCCAISMTDEEYENNAGFDTVGNKYILTEYIVNKDNVVPCEGGMIKIN
jgi:hypothetical protein